MSPILLLCFILSFQVFFIIIYFSTFPFFLGFILLLIFLNFCKLKHTLFNVRNLKVDKLVVITFWWQSWISSLCLDFLSLGLWMIWTWLTYMFRDLLIFWHFSVYNILRNILIAGPPCFRLFTRGRFCIIYLVWRRWWWWTFFFHFQKKYNSVLDSINTQDNHNICIKNFANKNTRSNTILINE